MLKRRASRAKASWLHPVALLGASVTSDDRYPRRRPGAVWSCVASLPPKSSASGTRPFHKHVFPLQYKNLNILVGTAVTTYTHDGVPSKSEHPYFFTYQVPRKKGISLHESDGWSCAAAHRRRQKRRDSPRCGHTASRGRRWAVLGWKRQAFADAVCCLFIR